MSGTTVPAVVAALLALAENVKPADAEVILGEPAGDEADGLFLAVMWTGDPDRAAIQFTDKQTDAADSQRKESYDVHHEISDWTGDVETLDALTSVCDFYNAYYAAIAADRRLGGVVDKATVSAGEYTPSSSQGAVATLRFVTHIEAWRTA